MNNVQDQENSQFINNPNYDQENSPESASSNDNSNISREDIDLVQHLIEGCLQLYMKRDEVVNTLQIRARIDPGFTTLVWQKLEEQNADFFRAYNIRLILKKQIILFNQLLEQQYHLMKYAVPPLPVNNLTLGHPGIQHPPVPATATATATATGQPHIYPMGTSHIDNGIPAPPNFHPMRMNSGNLQNILLAIITRSMPNNIPASPTSVASSGHFASEISVTGVDNSADAASSVAELLQLPPDNGVANPSDSQIPWNFSLSDITVDISDLGDLGAVGNYPLTLPSDSDIVLDSSEEGPGFLP